MNRYAYLLFMRSRTLLSPIIRAVTWSAWSHMAIIPARGRAFEARMGHGVIETTPGEILGRASRFQFGSVTVSPGTLSFLLGQVGRPYDYLGVIGVWVHRDWQRDDAWDCSELPAAACAAGGTMLTRKAFGRVTPQDCCESVAVNLYPPNEIPLGVA